MDLFWHDVAAHADRELASVRAALAPYWAL